MLTQAYKISCHPGNLTSKTYRGKSQYLGRDAGDVVWIGSDLVYSGSKAYNRAPEKNVQEKGDGY